MTGWLMAGGKPRAHRALGPRGRRRLALAAAALGLLVAASLPAVAKAATAADTVTVSGTITDGSGHGWPLYAGIFLYDPAAGHVYSTYTDPVTGQYSVAVPASTAYTFTVNTPYPGYVADQTPLQTGTTDLTQNTQLSVNQNGCTAPGYQASGGNCAKVSGGLIVGQVTDANTGLGIDGATVADGPASGTTFAPGDPNLSHGFYWLFSATLGAQTISASMTNYQSATASVTVTDDAVVRADAALDAGRLAITSAPVDATVTLGHTTTATITVTNSGGVTATATVSAQHPGPVVNPIAGARRPAAPPRAAPVRGIRHRAAVMHIPGHYSPRANLTARAPRRRPAANPRTATSGWTRLIGPTGYGVADSGLVRDDSGHIYSIGGLDGVYNGVGYTRIANGWVYDPAKAAWTPIAPLPAPVQAPMAAYADGNVYAIGGWIDHNAAATTAVRAYAPATNTWSTGTDMPAGRAAGGVAVLNNQIYVVGGCADYQCDTASDAWVYDPAADAWQAIAPYPAAVADLACGGIGTAVYCFGGTVSNGNGTAAGYAYQPATNTWHPVASLPADLWGASSAVANGQLLVSGGVSGGAITNAGYAYDPASNTWSSLPADDQVTYPTYRGAGACGFYRLGGLVPYGFPSGDFAALPEWNQCGTPDVPWLKAQPAQITVPADSSVNVTVTLDSTPVSQPGDFAAQITLDPTNTPYTVTPTPVTLHVTQPVTWSQVTGTVTLQPCTGTAGPADHATVEIPNGSGGSVPLRTDANGHYSYWAPWGDSTLPLLFAKNGYLVQAQTAQVQPGGTTTVNIILKPLKGCA